MTIWRKIVKYAPLMEIDVWRGGKGKKKLLYRQRNETVGDGTEAMAIFAVVISSVMHRF